MTEMRKVYKGPATLSHCGILSRAILPSQSPFGLMESLLNMNQLIFFLCLVRLLLPLTCIDP